MFSNHRGSPPCGMGGMGCFKTKNFWKYRRLWCFRFQFFFGGGGIHHRVHGRNQPHELIWRDSQYFCNQVFIYFTKLAIKKPYFRTMSRRKIIQLPPPKFNSKRSEKWWLVAGDPASYWVNSGNFSGAKLATFNFGYPGIPMAKPWQSQVWLHRALLQDIHREVSPARQAKGKKVGSLAPSTVTEVWNTVFCGVPFWGVKKWGGPDFNFGRSMWAITWATSTCCNVWRWFLFKYFFFNIKIRESPYHLVLYAYLKMMTILYMFNLDLRFLI